MKAMRERRRGSDGTTPYIVYFSVRGCGQKIIVARPEGEAFDRDARIAKVMADQIFK